MLAALMVCCQSRHIGPGLSFDKEPTAELCCSVCIDGHGMGSVGREFSTNCSRPSSSKGAHVMRQNPQGTSTLSLSDERILAEARTLAREALSREYDFSLKHLLDIQAGLDDAIASLFKAGQRSPEALARYAIHKAAFDHLRARERSRV